MEEPQEEVEQQNPAKRDKRGAVEATDKDGSAHVSDDALDTPEASASLTADVSDDVAPVVEEFMDQAAQQNEAAAEAVPDRKNKPGPYISFEHVYKSFGDFVVLEDVSFSILPGETLCILGRSGVGKSVSLQILMGFLRADQGRVMVAGEDICGMSERELQRIRQKVTMVFQNGALFDSISVGENVAFPLRERGDLAEDQIMQVVKGLLEMVGVAGMEGLLPSDLSTGYEALGCYSAGAGVAAGSSPVRRADDDGRPADGASAGQSDRATKAAASPHQHCCNARHAVREETCGPGRLSSWRQGTLFRNDGGDGSERRPDPERVSYSGRVGDAGMNSALEDVNQLASSTHKRQLFWLLCGITAKYPSTGMTPGLKKAAPKT